ncbi:MAG: right-handed parallel beta-helix repeat-containing protein [Methanothrix sp.]|nr:right-handed parallel beta-helix repeat-containing protein [Methanothrix sp.]
MGLLRRAAFCFMAFCILSGAVLMLPAASAAMHQAGSDLQSAIDAASEGDTLQVSAGVYDKITIEKRLDLVGSGAVIRAGGRDACVDIKADGVNISGFFVEDGFYGIKLDHVKGCRIMNNTVIHCTQPGIALIYSDENTITGNNASFNGIVGEGWYGIYLANSNRNIIANNEAYGNGAYGINLFPSCNNNTISENRLQGNMYGLYMFRDCFGNIIERNDLSKNTNSGLDLRFNCTGNLIANNSIDSNMVAGITLMESSGQNIIEGNSIKSNGRYGLQIQDSSGGNTITFNHIVESRTGIFLESSQNMIYGNRFIDNAIQADDRGTNVWNAAYPLGGNLWSDYHSVDEMMDASQDVPGRDGFGDEPYLIGMSAADQYPVMGGQTRQISVVKKAVAPAEARIGDSIAIEVEFQSRHNLLQAIVRARQDGEPAPGYCRLVPSGEVYQGSFQTALLNPGRYEMVLTATDERGYELEESLGEIDLRAR